MSHYKRILVSFVFSAALLPDVGRAQEANLLIITNRTLIDNQFIFGRNAASPPTLSKRIIDPTHRSVFGLSPTDSIIKASTSIAGGVMTGSPTLTFAGHTITRSGGTGVGSWISDGFAEGQHIFVAGAGSNNIYRARLTNVTATVLTLAADVAGGSPVSGATVRGGDRFVTVENFGSGGIDDDRRANTANITVDGNQPVPLYPQSDQEEQALSPWGATYTADGIGLDGALATVQNAQVHHCRGIGIAHHLYFGRVFDSEIHHCHTGIRVPTSDMEIRRCRIYGCRDACLFLARDSGNVQSTDNHCFGARIACYNEGAFPYRATGDTYADAWIGYFGSGYASKTVLTNILFQHNTVRDCVFSSYGCSLEGCVVEVMRDVEEFNHLDSPTPLVPTHPAPKVGIELNGENCSIRGGLVELRNWIHDTVHTVTGNAAEAIWVSGNGCVIETQLRDWDTVDGSIGIRVKGTVKGLRGDVSTFGFHDTSDRILVLDDPANCDGLDITLRVPGITSKPIADYIDVGDEWTGRIRIINTSTGETKNYVDGVEE